MSYNKNWIDAVNIKELIAKISPLNILSEAQVSAIKANFKEQFYSPNLFIRIGLFIFTFILVNAAIGIFGIAIAATITDEKVFGALALMVSGVLLIILHYFIQTKRHYKSGIDDCLLYMAVSFFIGGIILLIGFSNPKLILIVVLPFLILASYRYFDALLALCSLVCFYVLVFLFLGEHSLGKMLMPFVFLIISTIIAISANTMLQKNKTVYWQLPLKSLKVVGLLCMYLSVNYFVVREGNILLNESSYSLPVSAEYNAIQLKIDKNNEVINTSYSDTLSTITEEQRTVITNENDSLYTKLSSIQSEQIAKIQSQAVPFGMIFILFTTLFPLVFVVLALKNKDRLMLFVGLTVVALSVFTLKNYNKFLSIENAMTVSGILMLLFAVWAIRYLKIHNNVFTYEPDNDIDNSDLLNAEALIISQTIGVAGIESNKDSGLGGGEFGGGGAGGNY